ncbi:GNAT family N-acetyltransferase [Nocardioides sp.]|uniref:GNAT family N-acetyltransferase n=1 Tax=Nocardioides sp. TaxID=35761 RepID=UPI003D0A122B
MHTHDHIHLRLLQPGESHLVQDVFDQMSAQSRFLRYHAVTPRLTAAALRHLSAVEPGRHTVVVAVRRMRDTAAGCAGVRERGVGLARWIRLHNETATAELAVDVSDSYQGGGLGKALVAAAAASATTSGITHFLATVHPENRLVQSALRRLGARPRPGRPADLYLPVTALADRNERAPAPEIVVPWPRAVRRTGPAAGAPRRP